MPHTGHQYPLLLLRILEQVASLPVPLVPPCGGLRRAAPNGTMARCVGHIICVSSLGIACVSCVW